MEELLAKIDTEISNFQADSAQVNNKSAARRARKASSTLTKLFKEYRQQSIK